jgi:hypothetical protein
LLCLKALSVTDGKARTLIAAGSPLFAAITFATGAGMQGWHPKRWCSQPTLTGKEQCLSLYPKNTSYQKKRSAFAAICLRGTGSPAAHPCAACTMEETVGGESSKRQVNPSFKSLKIAYI